MSKFSYHYDNKSPQHSKKDKLFDKASFQTKVNSDVLKIDLDIRANLPQDIWNNRQNDSIPSFDSFSSQSSKLSSLNIYYREKPDNPHFMNKNNKSKTSSESPPKIIENNISKRYLSEKNYFIDFNESYQIGDINLPKENNNCDYNNININFNANPPPNPIITNIEKANFLLNDNTNANVQNVNLVINNLNIKVDGDKSKISISLLENNYNIDQSFKSMKKKGNSWNTKLKNNNKTVLINSNRDCNLVSFHAESNILQQEKNKCTITPQILSSCEKRESDKNQIIAIAFTRGRKF